MRVFGAAIDLLRLEISHYRLSGTDILERLDKLYGDFVETPRRCQILSHYVSYYLFERDGYALEKAIKYLIDVFRLNPLCEDVHVSVDIALPRSFVRTSVLDRSNRFLDPVTDMGTEAYP